MGGIRKLRVDAQKRASKGQAGQIIGRHKVPLLACTAGSVFFAVGLLSPLSVQEAAAVCSPSGNTFVCTGVSPSPSPFTPSANGFAVGVGSYISPPTPPSEAAATITGSGTGLVVNAGTFDGDVTVTPNSEIDLTSNNSSDIRHGLVVNAGNNLIGGVNVNIDGLARSSDNGYVDILGTRLGADSIRLAGNGSSTFTVNVGGANGIVGGGAGNNGIHVINAAEVTINNAGSIAAGTYSSSTGYGFVSLGQIGNAIKIGDALGSAITGTAEINNTGTITGIGGDLSPVIFARAAGGTTINNNEGGRIGDDLLVDPGAAGELVIASAGSGGAIKIDNDGTINGRMNFATTSGAAAVEFNNYSNNSWNTSGLTVFSGGDDTENNEGGTTTTTGTFATISFLGGDDEVINQANVDGDPGTMNLNADLTTFLMGADSDLVENKEGSIINANNNVIWALDGVGVQGKDIFRNETKASYVGTGTTTFIFGGNDDQFINRSEATFTATGPLNTFEFGSGFDSFVNDTGATFSLDAGIGANSILDLENLKNDGGSEIRISGLLNNITGLTGSNALVNDNESYFEMEGISFLSFSGGNDAFLNQGGASFQGIGATTFLFGGGNDTVTNTGGARIGSGGDLVPLSLLTFVDLETFNAEGGITDMRDGDVWDGIAMIGTNYHTNGVADHHIDAYLGGLLSAADFMVVGEVTGTGTTLVHINDINSGPGEYNPYGMAIAAVQDGNADAGDFRLADGPIQKGLFSYDIYLDDGNSLLHPKCFLSGNDDCFIIASVEGQRSFELPVISYGAQQMWHTSTGAWSDRTADLRSAFGGTGFGGGGADYIEPAAPAAAVGNVTPGIWGRVFGSAQSRDASNSSAAPFGLDLPGTTFDNGFDQSIYGVMAGIDYGRESLSDQGNQAWIFGVFGGYTGSNLDFDNSDTNVDYQAGSVGAYVTYLNGGLFVDGTFKVDFGSMDYSSGGDSGSADYTSIGGVIDAGYRMTMASGWYVEPKATLSYVSTDFDNIDVFGTDVEFNNGDSLRGRLGARLGTSLDRNGTAVEPYIEASVWDEFDGDYSASFFSNGAGFNPSFDSDGVYGEVALGASFANAGNGWSGFARGAVEFGSDSALGLTGNLGVRKAW